MIEKIARSWEVLLTAEDVQEEEEELEAGEISAEKKIAEKKAELLEAEREVKVRQQNSLVAHSMTDGLISTSRNWTVKSSVCGWEADCQSKS